MVHFHRHDDVVLCDGDHGWPDWVEALFATIHHNKEKLMAQQDQLNADVALLSDALTGIGNELTDLKASLAAQAPQLDLSALDAIAQKAINLAPPAPAAPTDTPAAPATDTPAVTPTVDTTPAADAGTPVIAPDGSTIPADSGTVQANVNM